MTVVFIKTKANPVWYCTPVSQSVWTYSMSKRISFQKNLCDMKRYYGRTSGYDHLSSATSFPKYQKLLSQVTIFGTSCKRPPIVSDHLYWGDHLSSATRFPKYQKFRSQVTIFGTSCKRLPLVSDHLSSATTSPQRPVFQNTKSFPVKSLYLEPLLSDHLSYVTATSFRTQSWKFSFVFNFP